MRFISASGSATLFAAALLLAACSSDPDVAATADTGGASSTTQTTDTGQVAPGSKEDFVINVGDRVFFDYDQYDLKPEAQAQLERQAAWLQQFPAVTLTVEGHCDERGTREYNLALGERRANAVTNYLVALGVDPNRLQTISYGKERPEVLGADESAWAQNRRAVSLVN